VDLVEIGLEVSDMAGPIGNSVASVVFWPREEIRNHEEGEVNLKRCGYLAMH